MEQLMSKNGSYKSYPIFRMWITGVHA